MKTYFILGIIVIIIGIICYCIINKKNKSIKNNISIILFTGIITVTILIFPLMDYKNIFTKLMASFFYAIRCAGMGEDLKILSQIDMTTRVGELYFILLNILFVTMPVVAVGFILSYIEDIYVKIRLCLIKNKELNIFSDINEKSLLIAKEIQNKKNKQVIFTNNKVKLDIKAICIKDKITNIKIRKNKVVFYLISDNEDDNLNNALELIDKYKEKDNIKINVLNNKDIATTILDSTDKGKIRVEIINEKERAIFNLLDNKPLFLNTINNTISILIVGCGSLGKEFLKDATWCGMLLGYKLKILVVDKNADNIKENIEVEAPEFLNNYDITFINADIKSKKAIDKIKERNDINYVLVSMDTDDKNLETAIMLRSLYLREYMREPIINLWVSNEYRRKQISNIVNERNNSYNLNTFGNIEDLYYENNIVNSNLEKLAIQIHLFYSPDDTNLEKYNLLEYNKQSSRASALHIKYKIYSILKDEYTDDMYKNKELFNKKYSKKIEELLSRNEHDRWVAYTRSIGYIHASIDEVKNYYKKTNSHIYYLAKKHPALVEYDELDKLSKELSKICKKDIDLKSSDTEIVRNIYENIEF